MEAVPLFAWLACAGCVAAVLVEWVLWYKLNPVLLPLLLLPYTPKQPLPRVQDIQKLTDFAGNGFTISWRWERDARAILFRRRMSMGRKAYVTGAIRFARDGQATVSWAPSPMLTYLMLPGLMLPVVYLDGGGELDNIAFLVALAAAAVVVGGINTFGAWWFLKKTGLPELQQQLDGWLK